MCLSLLHSTVHVISVYSISHLESITVYCTLYSRTLIQRVYLEHKYLQSFHNDFKQENPWQMGLVLKCFSQLHYCRQKLLNILSWWWSFQEACVYILAHLFLFSIFCLQDYHWWWRSFLTSGFTAVYLFIYAVHYFFSKLQIQGAASTILYFGYTMIMVLIFFLFTGEWCALKKNNKKTNKKKRCCW